MGKDFTAQKVLKSWPRTELNGSEESRAKRLKKRTRMHHKRIEKKTANPGRMATKDKQSPPQKDATLWHKKRSCDNRNNGKIGKGLLHGKDELKNESQSCDWKGPANRRTMVCRVNGPRIREPCFRQRQSQYREGIRGFGFRIGGGLGESHKIASVPGSRLRKDGSA